MSRLVPLLRDLQNVYRLSFKQGFVPTWLPGVRFFWSSGPVARTPMLYESGIVIIGQGHKIGYLGADVFRYDPETYLVLSVPIPFECETHATAEEPLLGIFIDVDVDIVREVADALREHTPFELHDVSSVPRGVEPVVLSEEMLDATARLLRILREPVESRVLGRSAVHEIVYRVLTGKHGQALLSLTYQQTPYARVSRVLRRIHRDYRETFSMDGLAREAAMSTSVFHRTFKQVTGESPLQYVKKVRLNKARSLIVHQGMRASEVAFNVGYESPSQFSREFKRYFRVSPSEARAVPELRSSAE